MSEEQPNNNQTTDTEHSTSASSEPILIRVQPTPNPNAWKFICNRPVKTEGKVTYGAPEATHGNRLALAIFDVPGVTSVHFFQNVITVTHMDGIDLEEFKKDVYVVIETRLPVHNPAFSIEGDKAESRKNLPQEIQDIEAILDKYIRPGLQGDGGDLEVLSYVDNLLTVRYEGACGSCPSASSGTLYAIEGILKDEYNPDIQVITEGIPLF